MGLSARSSPPTTSRMSRPTSCRRRTRAGLRYEEPDFPDFTRGVCGRMYSRLQQQVVSDTKVSAAARFFGSCIFPFRPASAVGPHIQRGVVAVSELLICISYPALRGCSTTRVVMEAFVTVPPRRFAERV